MSSPHTLKLDDDWDLHVDPAGNVPVSYGAYSVAQNVANFLIELKKEPMLNVLKSRLRQAALNVDGVVECEISLLNIDGRDLSGMATLTLENGEKYDVEL